MSDKGRVITRIRGVILGASVTLGVLLPCAVFAQSTEQPSAEPVASQNGKAADSMIFENPAHVQWRETIIHTPTPHEGCFRATFPNTAWEATACGAISVHTHPLPRKARPGEPQTTGNGHDYALVAGGL